MIGFININKPKGVSSAYVVNKVKKKFGVPCGHMGTLDPMASGVLPIAIGKATRMFDYLLDKDKEYVAEFEFGYETDTLDAEGQKVCDGGKIPTLEEILSAVKTQIGEISQIPPKYSAKSIGGERGYKLARRGVDFELPAKKITINYIKDVEKINSTTYRMTINCKGGTYIRSICRDIAYELDTYATMVKLTRTKSGYFTDENWINLDDFVALTDVNNCVLSADLVVNYPQKTITAKAGKRLLDGVFSSVDWGDGLYRIYCEDVFWGIGSVINGIFKMKSYIK